MNQNIKYIFMGILAGMLAVTTWASFDSNIMDGVRYVLADRWGIATLFDAYFGFMTFYVWVFYKENHWRNRLGWLIAIVFLGNIAMAFYMLRLLRKLGPQVRAEDILLRRSA